MDRSFDRFEWKPEESSGKHSQVAMPFLGAVPSMHVMDAVHIARATFSGSLNEAAKHSGMEDNQIADLIHISHGYMSKFMRAVGEQWAKRLVAFMRRTQSLAPLQWIADQMGCDVVVRSSKEARIRELESALAEARRAA